MSLLYVPPEIWEMILETKKKEEELKKLSTLNNRLKLKLRSYEISCKRCKRCNKAFQNQYKQQYMKGAKCDHKPKYQQVLFHKNI